ncbi:Talin-1 [Nowakowskiella sp. JEL0407]|nr:Talin-1 [Nowakowskiella sp. JEL0407]
MSYRILSLRITVEAGITKTLQIINQLINPIFIYRHAKKFNSDLSVHEACKEIREKFGEAAGGLDHSLYWPAQGKWLAASKVLDYYDLTSNDELEFKKKHRILKVGTVDGSIKTVLVDQSLPIQQLVEIVCEKIGIQNPEEYSFLPDTTHTSHASKSSPKRKGMDDNEDAKWLIPDKTLGEQGIKDSEIVILKKKFFFSDQNIDRNDPIQLNLMYNHSKEMIVSGKHPCKLEEAILFASLQCQVIFGNNEPDKHKPGSLKLSDFVPSEYLKKKELEKKIFSEHRKLQGLSELNAKFRYVQLSRSLKTYGITFFQVKERVPKKSKLVTVLLGVTKQSLVKLEVETKEILVEWKLTTLRRWAASPTSFTLDFGDYSNSHYSVQTNEGEAISQLIAGYIDIILKKRKEASKTALIIEDEQATVEEYVKPGKATNIGVVSSGQKQAVETKISTPAMMLEGNRPGYSRGVSQGIPQFGNYKSNGAEMSGAQQALLQNISNCLASMRATANDLNVPMHLPPMGDDAASRQWKQQTSDVQAENIASQISAHLAAIGSLINETIGEQEDFDSEAIAASVATLSSNLSQLSQASKMLAALSETRAGDKLLEAARELAKITATLLDKFVPVIIGEGTNGRQEVFGIARDVAMASSELLSRISKLDIPSDRQSEIVDAAKAVARAVAELVANSKNVANATQEQEEQQQILMDGKNCNEAVANLIACTNSVCPTINATICIDQLMTSIVMLRDVMACLSESSASCTSSKFLQQLKDATSKVEEAISRLMEKAKNAEGEEISELDRMYDTVVECLDTMKGNINEVDGIILSAKNVTLSSTQFVNGLKQQGQKVSDPSEKGRLLTSARTLAESTSKMVAAAKEAARNIGDPEKQANLITAIDNLRKCANDAAGPKLREKTFLKLSKASKDVLSSSNQLISASRSAGSSNRNQNSQLVLNQSARVFNDTSPNLVTALKNYNQSPEDTIAQMKLVNAAKQILNPGTVLTSTAKAAATMVMDTPAQNQLVNCVKQTTDALSNLMKALTHAEELSSGFELHGAIDSVKLVQQDLLEAIDHSRTLKPLKSQTAESVQLEMSTMIKSIQATISQLSAAATDGIEKLAGVAATDAVSCLQALAVASKGLAATQTESQFRSEILGATVSVADALSSLISQAKEAVNDPNRREAVANYAKSTGDSLSQMLSTMPGQRDLERTIQTINELLESFHDKTPPSFSKLKESFQSAQIKLQTSGGALTVAGNNLVNSCRASPSELQSSAQSFETTFENLFNWIVVFSAKSQDAKVVEKLSQLVETLSESAIQLLNNAKKSSIDCDNPLLRSELIIHARNIGDSVNSLLDVCSISAPGQSFCNNAIQSLSLATSKLDSLNDPNANRSTYAACLSKIVEQTKELGGILSSVTRGNDVIKMAEASVSMSKIVQEITESNSRAAYLVGLSDPMSVAATPGAIDQIFFSTVGREIKDACVRLVDPENSPARILESANLIAKLTSSICTACKVAGQNPAINSVARQQFIASTKDVASKTAVLVNDIKLLARNRDEESRRQCVEDTGPLAEAIDILVDAAMAPEFSGTKAKISSVGLQAQQRLVDPNKNLITAMENVINSIKMLCANAQDENARRTLSSETKAVNQAVQSIVASVEDSAPGQKECEMAMERLTEAIAVVDSAMVEATVNNLLPRQGPGKLNLIDTLRAVFSLIEIVAKNAKEDSFQLGISVAHIPEKFSMVATSVVSVASNIPDSSAQRVILDDAKDIGDALLGFVWACKSAGVSPDDKKLESEKTKLKNCVNKLIAKMEESPDESGEFSKAANEIENLISSIEGSGISSTPLQSYTQVTAELVKFGKALAETVADSISKAKTGPQYIALAGRVPSVYRDIVLSGQSAIRGVKDEAIKQGIVETARNLGNSCLKLVDAMRCMTGKNSEASNRLKLTQAARDVSEHVATLMTIAKDGSKGIIACQMSVASLNDVISDLETVGIFASAGQLDPMNPKDHFVAHKDPMLKSARAVTEVAKSFVTGIHGSQEEISSLASAAYNSINSLKEDVKNAATAITSADKHMQQQLLSAARSVAESFQDLIGAAILAAGKPSKDPAVLALGESVKKQFATVRELIQITKVLGDESLRGIRALDSSAKDIDEIVVTLLSSSPAQGTALPEEVAGLAKLLATAAASIVSSSHGKQDELVALANAIRKQVEDLARAAKAATEQAPDDKKKNIIRSVEKAAVATKNLILKIKSVQEDNSTDNKQAIHEASRGVISAVNLVVQSTTELIPTGYVDQNDPDVVAERELLSAASAIESIAKKMMQSTPEKPISESSGEIEGQLFDAAKAITAATASLIRSATNAQRDLVAKGKTSVKAEDKKYFSDGTWSDGLVSAAKQVAAATKDLSEVASQALKGKVPRERIIVSSKNVSSATVQLLTAAGVRADPNEPSQIRLRAAGAAVTNATNQLVRAVEEAIKFDDTDQMTDFLKGNGSATSAKVLEMEAQVSILKMEKELERARNKLAAVRKQKYDSSKNSPAS